MNDFSFRQPHLLVLHFLCEQFGRVTFWDVSVCIRKIDKLLFSFTDVPSCSNVQRLFRKFTWSDYHDVANPSFHLNHGIKQGSLLIVFHLCMCCWTSQQWWLYARKIVCCFTRFKVHNFPLKKIRLFYVCLRGNLVGKANLVRKAWKKEQPLGSRYFGR